MNWLLARLKEKSTWLGIFTLAGLCGMKIEPELREMIINAILAVAAVAAFVFREETKHDSLPPIDLVGRSDSPPSAGDFVRESHTNNPGTGFSRYRDPDDDGMPESKLTGVQSDGTHESGWNG